jgi:hypothetical protein
MTDGAHPLDRATRLTRQGVDWQGETSRDYWAFIGAYGGATAGTLMRAMLEQPERMGDPVSLTVNYCAAVGEGKFRIAPRLVRALRTMQHWSLDLFQGDDPMPLVTATAVTALRKPSWRHQPARAPAAPAPAEVPVFPTKLFSGWVSQYDMRFVSGAQEEGETEFVEPASARSVVWLRDDPARALDFVSLTAMSDAFLPRVFKVRGTRRRFGTVSLTTYFHASGGDLPAELGAFVLGEINARSFHRGFADQTAELYAEDGHLLATSHQVTFFRD